MLGIAFRYGVSLDDLLAANPGVDPQFLSVDRELVIPIEGTSIVALEAGLPTPMPLQIDTARLSCWRAGDMQTWCFLPFTNQNTDRLENISAQLTLYSPEGQFLSSIVAIMPLNSIPPGMDGLLVAQFSAPVPPLVYGTANVISAIPINSDDVRYVPAQLDINLEELEENRLSTHIQGSLSVEDAPLLVEGRVLAVAYNADGFVVGYRVVEVQGDENTPGVIPFEILVFGFSPIDRVEVSFEMYGE